MTADAGCGALFPGSGVSVYLKRSGFDLGRMGVMTNAALLPRRMRCYLDLRLCAGSSRHGFMTQGAQLGRILRNRQLAILRVTLGGTMAYFAGYGFVVAG